jgi:hypothetical protein
LRRKIKALVNDLQLQKLLADGVRILLIAGHLICVVGLEQIPYLK